MGIQRHQRGRNHSYTIDGLKVIGVTTAINEGWPKPQLISWAARMVATTVAEMSPEDLDALRRLGHEPMVNALKATPNQRRDTAALRGTKIHALAERIVSGEEVPVEDPDLLAHAENVARFMDDWKIEPLLNEVTIGSRRYGYAGTLDLVARIPDGRVILFDYKTGASGIWPDHALQLAAYRWADAYVLHGSDVPLTELGIESAKAVHVRADGYDVVPLRTDRPVFDTFLSCLNVARARASMKDWVTDVERPPTNTTPTLSEDAL